MRLSGFRTALLAALLSGCTGEPTPARRLAAPRADAPAPAKAGPGTPPASPAKLIERGTRAQESGDLFSAVGFLSQALQAEPTNREALRLLAVTAQRHAEKLPRPQNSPFYLMSGEAIRTLRDTYPRLTEEEKRLLPDLLYNLACTLSLQGESSRAIGVLDESCDAGLDRVELVETDPDLDSLRNLPGFLSLQGRLERRHAETILARATPFGFDFRLPGLDAKPLTLHELRGKVTVVVFWGTWCSPCRKQAAQVAELFRRNQKKGLAVVGLSYETEEGDKARKTVSAFVKEYGIPFPCLIGDKAARDQIPGFGGYPTTLFLDRDGKGRLQLRGYQSSLTLEAVADAMLDAGKGPPGRK